MQLHLLSEETRKKAINIINKLLIENIKKKINNIKSDYQVTKGHIVNKVRENNAKLIKICQDYNLDFYEEYNNCNEYNKKLLLGYAMFCWYESNPLDFDQAILIANTSNQEKISAMDFFAFSTQTEQSKSNITKKINKGDLIMIIIYDFDGTLTPFPLPQYEILNQCGYDDKEMSNRVKKKMMEINISLYLSYFTSIKEILEENNKLFNKETICLGSQEVIFNEGVLAYFKCFNYPDTGIKHYIVTSGFKEYVESTSINKYVENVYGTTFKEENGYYTTIDTLVTDEYKVNIIKHIQSLNPDFKNLIYFGDGLTDKYAFEYVHSIGGKTVFICSGGKNNPNYQELNKLGIIDECLEPDFSPKSSIHNFVKELIPKR